MNEQPQRSGWIIPSLLLFSIVLFIALGIWQLERRTWKLDLIDRVNRHIHQSAVSAPAPDQWSHLKVADHDYLHVFVRGTYLHTQETYVEASTAIGVGYWVLTPLQTDQGFSVLINRGFVPKDRRDPSTRFAGQVPGKVIVTGLLRFSEPHGRLLRTNDPQQGRWYSRDVDAIASYQKLTNIAPYFIDADAASTTHQWPRGGLTVVTFYNQHLVYALSWFALALVFTLSTIVAFKLPLRNSLRAFRRKIR